MICFHTYQDFTLKIKERRILNIAIDEIDNSIEVVSLLLEHGASINACENYSIEPKRERPNSPHFVYSRTPLTAAILAKKFDVAKYLVERGAIFNGILPTVVKTRDLDLLEFFLLKGSSPYEGMETAIKTRNRDAVIMLLNFGVNALSFLDMAVEVGDQEIIDTLMSIILNEENN